MSASSGVPAQSCSVARDDGEATHVERNNLLPHSTGFGRRERRGRRGRFCRSLNRSRSRLWRWRWGRRCRSRWRCRALRVGHFELILLLQPLHQERCKFQIHTTVRTQTHGRTDSMQGAQHGSVAQRLRLRLPRERGSRPLPRIAPLWETALASSPPEGPAACSRWHP